ncbi:MAG TPA: ABC transporter permease [Burkholderiaceae bacterium]|nr:ABC transporter permease [Burkholderiaceae bacterium]
MLQMVAAAWRFRQFVLSSVVSEFAGRFARSRLGALWMILNPLVQALTLAFVLSAILAARLPGIESRYGFALYLMAGTLAWSLFQETVNRCLSVFIDNGNLLKKLTFPRICLPLVVAGVALISHLLLALAVLASYLLLGHWPGWSLVWLPVLSLMTLALALGLGLALGVINVFIRDLGQVVPIVLQFGFWLSPIVYLPQMVPPEFRGLLAINPMFPLVDAFQQVLVYGKSPHWGGLVWVAVLTLGLLSFALLLFRRAGADMVDQL